MRAVELGPSPCAISAAISKARRLVDEKSMPATTGVEGIHTVAPIKDIRLDRYERKTEASVPMPNLGLSSHRHPEHQAGQRVAISCADSDESVGTKPLS